MCAAYVAYVVSRDGLPQGRRSHRMAKTILIVDDNAYIRQVLCQVFKCEADFEVCGEAENGKEAIAKALDLHSDLIVLDLSMPVMNGLDAARVLSRRMPGVPLILFSNYADILNENQASAAGISALVSKDRDICTLVSTAHALLHRSAA